MSCRTTTNKKGGEKKRLRKLVYFSISQEKQRKGNREGSVKPQSSPWDRRGKRTSDKGEEIER